MSYVAAEQYARVLNHARKLHSLAVISRATGVSHGALQRLSLGQTTQIRYDTAMKLRDGLVQLFPKGVNHKG